MQQACRRPTGQQCTVQHRAQHSASQLQPTYPVAVQLINLGGQLGGSAGLLHSLLIGLLQQIIATNHEWGPLVQNSK